MRTFLLGPVPRLAVLLALSPLAACRPVRASVTAPQQRATAPTPPGARGSVAPGAGEGTHTPAPARDTASLPSPGAAEMGTWRGGAWASDGPPSAATTPAAPASAAAPTPGATPTAPGPGGAPASGARMSNAAQVVAALRPHFRECYRRALARAPIEGRVTLRLEVNTMGQVALVTATQPPGGRLPLDAIECLTRVAYSARFDAPTERAALVIPLTLLRE